MIVTIGNKIVFYTTMNAMTADTYFNLTDTEPIFVLDSTPDVNLMATGMQNGSMSLWRFKADPPQE